MTGSAEISLATGDPAGSCFLTLNKNTSDDLMLGAQSGGPLVTVAETAGIVVPANGTLQEWCGISGSGGGGNGENYVRAAETSVITRKSPASFAQVCIASTSLGSEVIDAGITAIRILSLSGKPGGGGSI